MIPTFYSIFRKWPDIQGIYSHCTLQYTPLHGSATVHTAGAAAVHTAGAVTVITARAATVHPAGAATVHIAEAAGAATVSQ